LLAIVADLERQDRRRRRRRAAHGDPAGELHRDDVGVATSSVESRLDLDVAIARLARRQRMAIDLYYFVGLDVAETAQVMGCAIGTVKSTLADARSRLRAELEVHDGR
jgi:RNA polymerase sigma-70 factor (ECF subfamily)